MFICKLTFIGQSTKVQNTYQGYNVILRGEGNNTRQNNFKIAQDILYKYL